jgi:hypothetical protein
VAVIIVFRRCSVRIWVRKPVTDFFRGSPQYAQEIPGYYLHKATTTSFKSSPIHLSSYHSAVYSIADYSFIHSFVHSSMALQSFVGPWPLLQFRNFFTQTVELLG